MGRLNELPAEKYKPFLWGGIERKEESIMKPIIVILVVVLAIVYWCIKTVNGFKKKEIRVQEGLSGVDVALSKHYDMLTKTLDTAKGYMAHESELFTKVIELCRGMSIGEMNDAQRQMDTLSGKFFAVAENYPKLRWFTDMNDTLRVGDTLYKKEANV